MPPSKSHQECLELVCAVCTNLNGYKAKQAVSDLEVALIQKHVFPAYKKGIPWFPQGMRVRCAHDLCHLDKQKEKQRGSDGGGDTSANSRQGYREEQWAVSKVEGQSEENYWPKNILYL